MKHLKTFEKTDLVNILKKYGKIRNLAKTGVFENISHNEDEDDKDAYMGHFKSVYNKKVSDAHHYFLEAIIEYFYKYDIECSYDDEKIAVSDLYLYFHIAGIPMCLYNHQRLSFEIYEKIITDRPELKIVPKNVFYENSKIRSFFSVQECVEYLKKNDLLNTKLAPIAKTGIFENISHNEDEDDKDAYMKGHFKYVYILEAKENRQIFIDRVKKIFESNNLTCVEVGRDAEDFYLLINGVLMRLKDFERMMFENYDGIIKHLPALSLKKELFDQTMDSPFNEFAYFYSIQNVVEHFNKYNIKTIIENVKSLNPIAKTGIFERIKSFKNFEKE
jgi:hypothetical protein